MFCQLCGTKNPEGEEHCLHCHQKLLVVSGEYTSEDQEAFDGHPDEQFSFDEHLLERISILEEVVKRTAETVRQLLGTLYKLEQKILVNQTGITSLRDLLEAKRVIGREEWSELLDSRTDVQLLALEKRERFGEVKRKILGLYGGSRESEFRQHLDDAEARLLAFDIEGAVGSLERALACDRRNHELAFFLGETYFNEGETEQAGRLFDRVLSSEPEHFESLVYGGVLAHERGRSERAEELLRRAVRLYSEAFLPTFSLGAVYAARGDLEKAQLFLERAVAVDPVPQALYLLGSCCYENGELARAIQHLEAAVQRDATLEEALYLLAVAYLDRRWHRKALAALRDAERLRPRTLRYRELVALLRGGRRVPTRDETTGALTEAEGLLAAGRVKQALSCHRRALSRDPQNADLLLAYAMACLEVGRAEEVPAVIDKLLGLELGERLKGTAYATLIEALRSQGRHRDGNRIGLLLVGAGSSDFVKSVAYYEMAYNLAELEEELDDALGFARRSLELSSREVRPLALAALGWVHYKRREYSEAVDCLRRASQAAPSARTLTHLAMALLAGGERATARGVLVEARGLGGSVGAADEKLLECLRDSARLLQEMPLSTDGPARHA